MPSDTKSCCPSCNSLNNYFNEIMMMHICGYCFFGFDKQSTDIPTNCDNFKNYLNDYIENVDILFGQDIVKSKINIELDNVSNIKYLNSKIYPFVEKNKLIKSILVTDISQILIKNIFEYKKVFDPDINIWILNPNLKYSYAHSNSKYVYTIFSIYKIISLYDMDIHEMFNINNDFNLIKIKFGPLLNDELQSNFQNYATQEIHSKIFNPKLCL